MKLKFSCFFTFLVLIFGVSLPAFAGGSAEANLVCHGQHTAFSSLSEWDGSAGTFYAPVRVPMGTVDGTTVYSTYYYILRALYSDVKPYVLRSDLFLSNPNYFRDKMSGSDSSHFLIWETDSDYAEYEAAQLHKYAVPIASVDSSPVSTGLGAIRIAFTRADGSQDYRDINVRVQKRWCTAYQNKVWTQVSDGRWESQ